MIQRRASFAVFALTVGVLAVVALLLYFLHGRQLLATVDSLAKQAKASEDAEDYLKAAEKYQLALGLRKDDPALLVSRAVCYAKAAQAREMRTRAVAYLVKAKGVAPEDQLPHLSVLLAEQHFKLQEFALAKTQAEFLLDSVKDDPDGSRILALSLLGLYQQGAIARDQLAEKEIRILTKLRTAQERNETDDQVVGALATVYRQYPEIVEAELPDVKEPERVKMASDLVDSFVKDHGTDPKAWLVRAIYRKQFRIVGAEEDARTAIDVAGDDVSALRTAFFVLFPTEGNRAAPSEFEEAINFGEKLLKEHSLNDPELCLALGQAYYLSGNVEKAIETWQAGKEATNLPTAKVSFLSNISDALIQSESTAEVKTTLDETASALEQVRLKLPGEEFRKLQQAYELRRSLQKMMEGDTQLGIAELQTIVTKEEKTTDINSWLRAVILLAEAYAKNGDFVEAAKVFDRAVETHPNINYQRASAGRAWLAAGQFVEARNRFADALGREVSSSEIIEYGSLLLDAINRSGPPQADDKQLAAEMKLLNTRLIRLVGEEDPEVADTVHWRVPAMRSEWKRLQKALGRSSDGDDGLADLKEVEKRGEKSVEALSFLCLDYELRKMPEEADRLLAKLAEVGSNTSTRYVAELQLAAIRKDLPRVVDIFGKMTNVATPLERTRRAVELSSRMRRDASLDKQTRNDAARKIVEIEIDRSPQSAGLWKLLVEIDLDRRDGAAIARTFDQLTANPIKDTTAWLYAKIFKTLVNSKSTQKELQQALRDQAEFAQLRPGSFESETLRGLIEHQLGTNARQRGLAAQCREHYKTAVQAYDSAIKRKERRLFVYENLNDLVQKIGAVANVPDYVPDDKLIVAQSPMMTEIVATRKRQSGQGDEAIKCARQGVEARPNDATAHQLLARLLALEGRFKDAEQEFAAALELGENSPGLWIEYFEFRARRTGKSSAQELLNRLQAATKLVPAQKALALARAYELLDDREKANEHYLKALEASPDAVELSLYYCTFLAKTDPDAAIARLREMNAASPDNFTVLRNLASALFAKDDAGAAEAEKLLLEGELSNPDVADNRRRMIRLWSQRNDLQSTEKALALATKVFAAYPESDGDRLNLVGLMERFAKHATDKATRDERLAQAKKILEKSAAGNAEETNANRYSKVQRAMNLARFAVRQGDADVETRLADVDKELDQVKKIDPEVIADYMTLCAAAKWTNNWEKWADRLDDVDTNQVRKATMRAKFLVMEGKRTEAKKLLQKPLDDAEQGAKDEQRLLRIEGAGRILTDLEMHPEAAEWYRKLVKADPTKYQLLATSLARAGQLKEALDLCTTRYRESKDVTVLYAMTDLISTHGKSDGAIKTVADLVRDAMKTEQRNVKLLESAAVLEFLSSKHDESERLLREALAIAPRDVSVLNNLACVLADKGIKLDEAVTLVDKAIEIQSGEAPLLDTKGIVLLEKATLEKTNLEKALPLLEMSTSHPNKDPRHHLHLAVAYQMAGKGDDAKKQIAKAKELGIDTLTLTPLDARYLKKLDLNNTSGS
jgi:tetratricopeptide (TPR) repeat protein